MRNEKITAGRKVAKAIRPSEDAIDTSIAQTAHLLAALVEGRQEMGVAADVGHDAVMSASAGITALATARDHVVTCHQQIAATRDQLGFNPHAFGCTIGKLPMAEGTLSLVGRDVA